MTDQTDAYGNALMDYLRGNADRYGVERDDKYLSFGHMATYFQEYGDWPEADKRMPEFVRGRVLDVGCGAGRHSLHLQDLGFEVLAIDKSPLAIEIAKQRGVKNAVAISIDDFIGKPSQEVQKFDSIIMMGHNIGLLHSWKQGRKILSRLAELSSPEARIIGTTLDVGATDKPHHLAYQENNLKKGRMRGQIRLRIRYEMFVGEWLDYLFVAEEELKQLIDGTGWKLETTISGDAGFRGPSYLAVLKKEAL